MLLLIPGPVTTAEQVRRAMNVDLAPWDRTFRTLYTEVLERLLVIAGGDAPEHVALPLQGSGHFCIEAAIRTFVPKNGTILIPSTGSFGEKMIRLAREAGRNVVSLPVPDDQRIDPSDVCEALAMNPEISHLGLVYSETGTGIVHNAPEICAATRRSGRRVIVDAVSAFGAFPLELRSHPEIDAIVFTANKCLEAVAGVAFIAASRDRLLACRGNAESWVLDMADVHEFGTRRASGFSRFTPPTHAIAALSVALDLFDAEGGQSKRLKRYQKNLEVLYDGIERLRLTPYISRSVQGPIVMNIRAPLHPAWDLTRFVDCLRERGILISDFFLTAEPSFRVGCVGAVEPSSLSRAVDEIEIALDRMGIGLVGNDVA